MAAHGILSILFYVAAMCAFTMTNRYTTTVANIGSTAATTLLIQGFVAWALVVYLIGKFRALRAGGLRHGIRQSVFVVLTTAVFASPLSLDDTFYGLLDFRLRCWSLSELIAHAGISSTSVVLSLECAYLVMVFWTFEEVGSYQHLFSVISSFIYVYYNVNEVNNRRESLLGWFISLRF